MNFTSSHDPFPRVDIVALLWRRKWTIILFAIAGTVLAGLNVATSPRQYLAESTLLYRFGREYSPVVPGEQGRNWGESIQVSLDTALFTEMRLLKDGDVLKEVVVSIRPDQLTPKTRVAIPGLAEVATAAGWVTPRDAHRSHDDEIATATQVLAATLMIRRIEGATMLTVGFRHPDPLIAERVVDAVVAAYRAKRRALFNRNAADFYAGQIDDVQAQLTAIQAEKTSLLNAWGVTEVGTEQSISIERLLRLEQQATLRPTNEELSGRIAATRQMIVDLDVLRNQIDLLEIRRNGAASNLGRLIELRNRWVVDASYVEAVDSTASTVESAAGSAAPVGASPALQIALSVAFGVIIGTAYVLLSALVRRRRVVAVEHA